MNTALPETVPAPEVLTSTDAGTVTIVLEREQAELLARILVQYGAVMSTVAADVVDPVNGFDRGMWDRAAIDLLAAAASLGVVAEPINVHRYTYPASRP